MGRKAEIIKLMKQNSGRLIARPDKTAAELMELGERMPVIRMTSPEQVFLYIEQSGMNLLQGASFAEWVLSKSSFIDKIVVNDKITYSELRDAYGKVETYFADTNRLNYILHDSMLDVYDLLEREKRMKFLVRKCCANAEGYWDDCFSTRRLKVEKTAWYTMQDHMNLYCARLKPYLEKVYESVRDYMIRQALRDVELRARCAVALFVGKVTGVTYRQFFEDFMRQTGADFSRLFAKDDLQAMVAWFAKMCDALGFRISTDHSGGYILDGLSLDDSQRMKWAWDDFMRMLRDVDVMDEAARCAIELNPKVKEDYEKVLAQEAREREAQKQKEMEEGFQALAEKFKVTKEK